MAMILRYLRSTMAQWLVAIVFAVLGLVLLYHFVRFAEPAESRHVQPFVKTYDDSALGSALSEVYLQQTLAAVEAAGTAPQTRGSGRFTGSPGFYRTAELIKRSFAEADLEVSTQPFPVAVPVTELCEVCGADGKPLPGVTLYPFEPSGLMPTNFPEAGVTGALVATDSTEPADLVGKPIEGNIILNAGFNCNWPTFASLGAKAVLVTESAADLSANPDVPRPWSKFVTVQDIPYPRFLVRGPIEKYVGQPLTLRCKSAWQTKMVDNVIGVLRSPHPAREALVISSYYDSASLVPELAPGGEQALSLATLLRMAQAFARYRAYLTRDVIFVAVAARAQGQEGTCRLLQAVDDIKNPQRGERALTARLTQAQRHLDYANRALALLDDTTWAGSGASAFATSWASQDAAYRQWVERGFTIAAGEVCLERQEATLQGNLEWIRAGKPIYREGAKLLTNADRQDAANIHPLYRRYQDAKIEENVASNTISVPFWRLPAELGERFTRWQYLAQARRFFLDARAYEQRQVATYDGLLKTKALFTPYDRTLTINLELPSGGASQVKDLVVIMGRPGIGTVVEPQVSDLRTALSGASGAFGACGVTSWGAQDAAGGINDPSLYYSWNTLLSSQIWFACNRLAYTITNKGFYPAKVGTPDDVFAGLATGVVGQQAPQISQGLLTVACGNVPFKTLHRPTDEAGVSTCRGTIVTSADANAQIPSHPMGQHTVVCATGPNRIASQRGIMCNPVMMTNPYGEYERPLAFDLTGVIKVLAMRSDDAGTLRYYADSALGGSSVFQNEKVAPQSLIRGKEKPVSVALFRCAQSSCFHKVNPKTLNSYAGFDFLREGSLQAPDHVSLVNSPDAPAFSAFLPPDFPFVVALRDGSMENPEVQTYRAFMLNVDPHADVSTKAATTTATIPPHEPDLAGRGYLAADTPNLTFPYFDAAASMLRTNAKRLRVQIQYHMADQQMLEAHNRACETLQRAWRERANGDTINAINDAGRALADATNNHPVIRVKISSAILGILWYLGLLIPFAVFCEKLLFGFTDIRKQLLAAALIFIGAFLLLQVFHPAFRIVTSPPMILLGFLIALLALLVTVMVGGKFQETIKGLRQRGGLVEGADINRAGVVGTAFMLGLNNMRRRKVRTGLTCVTLVLLTFVMICFTSVTTDVIDNQTVLGRSPSNGILRRDPNFRSLSDSEISNLRQLYGLQYPIAVQSWLVGWVSLQSMRNAEILIDRPGIGSGKRAEAKAAVAMAWNEPQFSGIDRYLLTKRTWFPRPPSSPAELARATAQGWKPENFVILPDTIAQALDITVDDINRGTALKVTIRNEEFTVLGIIDSLALTKHVGMDGQSILPYDLDSIQIMGKSASGNTFVVPANVARLYGSQVILTNKLPVIQGPEQYLTVSCSIGFPSTPYRLIPGGREYPAVSYREQRTQVAEYLERIGIPGYFAIDGTAYAGERGRGRRTEGIVALLIPLLLAALTVFNTMRGSVYERREEIYVYNAVGIAPNHVFFMFMAEACVYAVIGALAGYLLSQIVGSVLTAFGLTTGLNMDYSSIETIWASVAIVGSVLLSTIIPARTAARLALPSDETSWTVPQPEGDTLQLTLPFTFSAHDRVAVMSYFHRWLDANGEGSSGAFFCNPPELSFVERPDETRSAGLVPCIASTVWLKPYDLGISQRIMITLPTDPETEEYVARVTIERLSGTMSGWQRAVIPFLAALRKQFLSWRAVNAVERAEMYAEAESLFRSPEATPPPVPTIDHSRLQERAHV